MNNHSISEARNKAENEMTRTFKMKPVRVKTVCTKQYGDSIRQIDTYVTAYTVKGPTGYMNVVYKRNSRGMWEYEIL